MRTKKTILTVALMALLIFSAVGCIWKRPVETNEVAIFSKDGVSTTSVVGAGRYTDGAWRSELHVLDASAKTVIWNDPSLLTGDSQPIGIDISVSFRRPKSDCPDCVERMWDTYRTEAKDDDALKALVLLRLPEAVKSVTPQHTLQDMTGISDDGDQDLAAAAVARQKTSEEMEAALQRELDDTGVMVLNLAINDIAPDEVYVEMLREKARADAALDLSKARTLQLAEQKIQEAAQTEIDIEIARRDNLVAEEEAKVYAQSEEAFELQRLRLLADVIGPADKIYFVPEGADMTLILGQSNAIPISK